MSPIDQPPQRLDETRLWPHLPERWRLAGAAGWLAFAKPSQVPIFGRPPRRDDEGIAAASGDLMIRVARSLGGDWPATSWRVVGGEVGGRGRAHGVDDALSSGVVVVATDAATAAAWDAAATAGALQARFVAGVYGWPTAGLEADAGLRAGMRAEGVDVRVQLDVAGDATRPSRALIELRTQHLDLDLGALLAARGVRVASTAGEPTGEAARRLWHRAALHVDPAHVDGAATAGATSQLPVAALRASTPPAFAHWLHGRDEGAEARLRRALRRRYGLARVRGVEALRLYDDERGLVLDRFGDDLVVAVYDELPKADASPEVLAATLARERARAVDLGQKLGFERVWLKLRPRQANTIVDAVAAGWVPDTPVLGGLDGGLASSVSGAQRAGEGIVDEDGVRYWVDLGDGLQTGLFLDQRDNRRWLRLASAGLDVLNTFAFTCAFQVAAAVGGARRTVSIDASARALERGRRNLALNACDDPERHDTLRGDVFHWLPRMARRGDRFDLVVLDPPSYAKVRKRRFVAARDYGELVASALEVLRPGGLLLAAINDAGVDHRRFEQLLRDGCRLARRGVETLNHRAPTIDHPSGRMKSALLRVG